MQEQQRPAAEQPVEKSKQAYEKPQLRSVKLFADQVLGSCYNTPVCPQFPRS